MDPGSNGGLPSYSIDAILGKGMASGSANQRENELKDFKSCLRLNELAKRQSFKAVANISNQNPAQDKHKGMLQNYMDVPNPCSLCKRMLFDHYCSIYVMEADHH